MDYQRLKKQKKLPSSEMPSFKKRTESRPERWPGGKENTSSDPGSCPITAMNRRERGEEKEKG